MAINYQWQLSTDGGETYRNIEYSGASLTITGIKPIQHNYMYRCRMNRGSSKKYRYSKSATLKVLPEINISTMPDRVSVSGGSLSLNPSIATDPSGTTLFQWQYSDNAGSDFYNLVNATGSGLSLSNLTSFNNNWLYRLRAVSYYSSGINNTVFSNNTRIDIGTDLPEIQIWKNPQNHYGSGSATFEVVVAGTGLDSNGNPLSFYSKNDGLTYAWEESLDGKNWYSLLDDTDFAEKLTVSAANYKAGCQYRVNVSKNHHTILSESASAFDSFDLLDLSHSITRNYYSFNRINGGGNLMNAQFFCNNPQNSQEQQICQNKLRLLTIVYANDTYDLVLDYYNYNQIPSHDFKYYFIKDVILYKNGQQTKSASLNYTRVPSSEAISNISPTSISYLNNTRKQLTSQYIGLAGKSYGKGYCVNFNTTLAPSMLIDRNYIQLLQNSIIKCSSKKYGSIKVAITTTGRSNIDTQYLSSLPKVIKVLSKENNIIANVNVSYTILPNSNTFDGSLDYDVIILNNSYNWSSKTYANSEQIKLRQYVADGGGLITGEWVLWNAARNKFRYLQEVFPIIPTTRYNSNRKIRLYQYDSDEIINYNVDKDFSFAAANVAGTQTLATVLDRSADLFYVNEVSKVNETSETVYFEETEFNILDIFKLTATPANEITSSTIGKTYNCKYTIGPKIDKDIYIGGMLYWIYKSLIEHTREPEPGLTKPASPWDGSRSSYYTPDGRQGNQLNDVLSPYGLTFEKFYYNPGGPSSQYELMTSLKINDNFWKDLSRLMAGFKPINSLNRNSREIQENKIFIVHDGANIPSTPDRPSYNLRINQTPTINYILHHTNNLPINATLQLRTSNSTDTEVFEDLFTQNNIDNNLYFSASGMEPENTYRVLFTSKDGAQVASRYINTTYATNNLVTAPSLISANGYYTHVSGVSGTFASNRQFNAMPVFAKKNQLITPTKRCDFVSWQYSYDNKNFYNTNNNVVNNTNDTILNIGSGEYDKAIRYSYNNTETQNIAYSKSVTYNPISEVIINSQVYNRYQISGLYYIDLTMLLTSGVNTREEISNADASGIIWQQYNPVSNIYENVPSSSGYSVLNVSGIPADLQDNYKFRAVIHDRIIYS